jgi:hypothetical protein
MGEDALLILIPCPRTVQHQDIRFIAAEVDQET